MSAGVAIYNLLIANSTITTKVGERVFPGFIPQDTQFPAVTYAFDSQTPSNTKDGASKLDTMSLSIRVFHEDYVEAVAIGDAIRSVLDFYNGTQSGVTFNRITFQNQDDGGVEYAYEFTVLTQSYNVRMKR